jgi:hypothetical protein
MKRTFKSPSLKRLAAGNVCPKAISALAFRVLNVLQDQHSGNQIMTIAVMHKIMRETQEIPRDDLELYVRNLLKAHNEKGQPILELRALEGYMKDEL